MPPADRAQLNQIVANGNTPQKLALRARVVLMLADRQRPRRVGMTVGLSRNQIYLWMHRYLRHGVTGCSVTRRARRAGNRSRPPRSRRL